MNRSLEGTRCVMVLNDFNFTIFSISLHACNESSVLAMSCTDSLPPSWLVWLYEPEEEPYPWVWLLFSSSELSFSIKISSEFKPELGPSEDDSICYPPTTLGLKKALKFEWIVIFGKLFRVLVVGGPIFFQLSESAKSSILVPFSLESTSVFDLLFLELRSWSHFYFDVSKSLGV